MEETGDHYFRVQNASQPPDSYDAPSGVLQPSPPSEAPDHLLQSSLSSNKDEGIEPNTTPCKEAYELLFQQGQKRRQLAQSAGLMCIVVTPSLGSFRMI